MLGTVQGAAARTPIAGRGRYHSRIIPMSSFLLVSPRTGDDIVAQEYKDFLQATGLSADELAQVQLDST